VSWTDWSSASAGTVLGTITLPDASTIGVTYSGNFAFAQTSGGGQNYWTLPAPGSLVLLGSGLATLAGLGWRARRTR
jgi:hypothetical protein